MDERIMDYDVSPSIVKSGEKSKILIRPKGNHARFKDEDTYLIKFIPMECCNVRHALDKPEGSFDTVEVIPCDGAISFAYSFTGEQEWSVLIMNKKDLENKKVIHIYSLFPDLYMKKAYKGDFHIHTSYSDGHEEPAVVAANYRKAGFDFISITDHAQWYPSIEAIDKFKNVDTGLKLFLGEEVHVPGSYIHTINFGGNISVNDLYRNNKNNIDKEVEEAAKGLNLPEGINALEFAYRKWIAHNIRKGGGFAILVHPFWVWFDEYNMQTKMTEYLFETQTFDAFELIGGQTVEENNMQTALYYEQRAKGIKIPVVGSSDSHGTEPPVWFNTVKTILFSEDLEFHNICKNIKELYSVAVHNVSERCSRIEGPFRMVKYAMFLEKYYFPRHDQLCFEEGLLMKDYICGDTAAKEHIPRLSARVNRYAADFFGF